MSPPPSPPSQDDPKYWKSSHTPNGVCKEFDESEYQKELDKYNKDLREYREKLRKRDLLNQGREILQKAKQGLLGIYEIVSSISNAKEQRETEHRKELKRLKQSRRSVARPIRLTRFELNRDLKILLITGHIGWGLIWLAVYLRLDTNSGFGNPSLSHANETIGGLIVFIWSPIDKFLEQFLGNPLSDVIAFLLTYMIFIVTGTMALGMIILGSILWLVAKIFGLDF